MRGTTIVLLIIALFILVGVTFFITNPEAAQQVLVELGLTTPPANTYTASGVLEVPMVALGSESGGRVEELSASEGDPVSEGDILARLSSEFHEAQREVLQARLDAAQGRLDMLQAGASDEDLAVAEAAIALAEAALAGANQALEDAQDLNPFYPAREELILAAEAAVTQAQAGLDVAQAAMQLLEDGAGEAALEAAQAAVDVASAELSEIDRQIANQAIRSPREGVVMQQLLLVGELALPGWPIVMVADLSEIELKVYIPEADLNWVQLDQPASVKIDAYPDRTFEGVVTHIADEAEFTPRNVQTPNERVILVYAVTIRVANPDGALKPGLPADAIFEVPQ